MLLKKYIKTPTNKKRKRGGRIVFKTIAENIRSFFGKEDELLAKPKAVPQAASEVYERPSIEPGKIVERSLPEQQKLPFTPDELRAALREKAQPAPAKAPPAREVHEIEHDITSEINAFESALQDVHTPESRVEIDERSLAPTIRERTPSLSIDMHDGFFDEFAQFLLREDIEAEGLLESDIIHRMREFHKRQQEGKEYYIYSKDVQSAITRKLKELKLLEHEWFHTRKQIDEMERGIHGIEHEIETHTHSLKDLLKQAKSRSRLEQRVAAGQEFALADGRTLATLLDLKIALRTMPDEIFFHHVSADRNDFATWVRGAMHDDELAGQLAAIRDRHQLDVFLSRLAG